jgi:hypothetical protein
MQFCQLKSSDPNSQSPKSVLCFLFDGLGAFGARRTHPQSSQPTSNLGQDFEDVLVGPAYAVRIQMAPKLDCMLKQTVKTQEKQNTSCCISSPYRHDRTLAMFFCAVMKWSYKRLRLASSGD